MNLTMRKIVSSGRIVLTAEYDDTPGVFVVLTLTSFHGPYQKNDSRFKRARQKPPADPTGWLRGESMRVACHLIETAFRPSTVMACGDDSGYSVTTNPAAVEMTLGVVTLMPNGP